ncbi:MULTISPECIES: hydroxyethylthiazole kinase [unclassified Acinetobacter]|uniref:hydroxyethylthiazole kinase n=1 Tax=unclassified Acinetobacter TaxID=196816 RepID=UPI0015D45565|nr:MULTISPECIES: hydroxyethylthiazole kinase [unclassified Acinetobacter]
MIIMNTSTQALQHTLLDQICEAWLKLQQHQPLVHIMTNAVASNYVANVVLAANASPAMIDNPFEAESFAKIAAAINLNLGTPTTEQVQAMHIAAETAHRLKKPWVLDPVGYGTVLHWRSNTVDQLLNSHPTILRGNASEIGALAGKRIESKGVDSTINSADVYLQAQSLLAHCDCVAISGESDYIISRDYPVIQVSGGSYLQPRVTATGCALGALIAAYSAVSSPAIAALAAHVHFAIAGQRAFERAPQLGSFNMAFLDEVHQLNTESIRQYANFQILPGAV